VPRRPSLAAIAASLLLLSACSHAKHLAPVAVAPPSPSGAARAACERLYGALPATIGENAHRRTTSPASDFDAAWGDPAIVLTCGGAPPKPPLIGAGELTVNGVDWFAQPAGSSVQWFALKREVSVRVDIPISYRAHESVLADLSTVVAPAIAPHPTS